MKPSEPIRILDYSIDNLQNDRDNEYKYERQFDSLIEYIHENKLYSDDTQRGVVAQTKDRGTITLSEKQKEVLKQVFKDNDYEINYCQNGYCQEQIPIDEVYDTEYCEFCTINDAKR
ncbi:hypothetical protein ACE193_25360 (plasmid) [Bernardetia sp. OM2101]|uniref:hypothetical protein n=1 Tax=Bernardetia sp. OM2101 TaxID=3344876 RepID=UPI0035CFD858